MGKILLRVIVTVFLGWVCWNQAPSYQEALDFSVGRVSSRDTDSTSSGHSRGMFSSYVVGGLDCMDDGSYEDYVESLGEGPGTGTEQEEQVRTDAFPKIRLRFMGLDLTDYIGESDTWKGYAYHKAFCSDVFYMEYPWNWYVGSTDACPLTFVPEWEEEASRGVIHDWAEYVDDGLQGNTQEVRNFIEGGGINGYLEEVTGKPVTEAYTWKLREDNSEWLLIYDLMKGEKQAAEIVVWCNLGKCDIRNWDVELTVEPEEDYGRILVFQEWKSFDFSSEAAIQKYVESEDFLYRLLGRALEEDVENQIICLDPGTCTTFYHDFVTVDVGIQDKEGSELLRQAWVYIPVVRPEQCNWVVVFETFPGTRQDAGVGSLMIRPGQQIEIPLRVLFRRVHHR